MLNGAHIINFQSHHDTHLEFHPGVNVLIGNTDAGKSAALRALVWGLKNELRGDFFRTYDTKESAVHFDFDNGELSRVKKSGFNGYVLNGDKLAGGTGVPDPVAQFINMGDLNFHDQDDPHFMISWSPGERGKFLNEISNLEDIDISTLQINRMVDADKSGMETAVLEIERLSADLKAFDYLPDLEKEIIKLEELEARIDKLDSKIDLLEELITEVEDLEAEIKEYDRVLLMEETVDHLLALGKRAEEAEREAEELADLIENITSLQIDVGVYQDEIEKLEEEFHQAMPDECPLCGEVRL